MTADRTGSNRRKASPATTSCYSYNTVRLVLDTTGHFTCWDHRLRPNCSTLVSAGVEINQSPQLVIAHVIGDSLLILPYFFVYFWITEKVKWFRSSKLNL